MDRMKLFLGGAMVVSFAMATLAFSGCTTILGDFEVNPSDLGNGEAGATARANGEACGTGAECNTGFCADGVCCDVACNGVCESCAGPLKGTCSPVPAGTDPEKECKPEERLDAGAPDASGEGGVEINLPDGGSLQSNDALCAGSCDGKRACAFPGKEKVCGTEFCNTTSQAAAYTCDTKGRCELGFTECGAFACEANNCRKTCAAPDDCGPTSFCNPTGFCQDKLANGVVCTLSSQCGSGYCVEGVCCNSACTDVPGGGTCKQAGSEGTCRCSIECLMGCTAFYQDKDGDGHAAPGAKATVTPYCVGDTPPMGYAVKQDDCNDSNKNVFPGQTEFFEGPTATGSWDYDCDGEEKPFYAVHEDRSCRTCVLAENDRVEECAKPVACPNKGPTQTALTCRLTRLLENNTCRPDDTAGFVTAVGCGDTGKYVQCGTCAENALGIKSDERKQKCR